MLNRDEDPNIIYILRIFNELIISRFGSRFGPRLVFSSLAVFAQRTISDFSRKYISFQEAGMLPYEANQSVYHFIWSRV